MLGFFFKYVKGVIFVHCSMQCIYFWDVISIYSILKLMFKIIGEHLLLRRNYLIRYFKKRFRKTLPDAIRVSIAVIWKEFCLRLKMSILYTLSDKNTLLRLYCNEKLGTSLLKYKQIVIFVYIILAQVVVMIPQKLQSKPLKATSQH